MCNISINFLSYTLPLEFLLYMQPLKVRGPASRITTPWWNGLLRQLSVSTRGVLEGGTKLVSHQFGFVGVIQIQVGQFTKVSTGIPDQVEATENGRLMSPCIFKEANGSAAPNCSIWYDYNFCTSVSQGFATFPLVEIYHEDQRKAIASIPAYILRCEFFVALCPGFEASWFIIATLGGEGLLVSKWRFMARELSARNDGNGMILLIESPAHVSWPGTHGSEWKIGRATNTSGLPRRFKSSGLECSQSTNRQSFRWWFQVFLFSPLLGEDFQFDEHIFQMGWNHQPVFVHFWAWRNLLPRLSSPMPRSGRTFAVEKPCGRSWLAKKGMAILVQKKIKKYIPNELWNFVLQGWVTCGVFRSKHLQKFHALTSNVWNEESYLFWNQVGMEKMSRNNGRVWIAAAILGPGVFKTRGREWWKGMFASCFHRHFNIVSIFMSKTMIESMSCQFNFPWWLHDKCANPTQGGW